MKRKIFILVCTCSILALIAGCNSTKPEITEIQPLITIELVQATPTPKVELKPEATQAEAIEDQIQLIFSHDGAPDDISTMAYIARHPKIKLLGVVNSYGEQHPSQSADEWARFLYEVIDMDDVSLGIGSETSLDPTYKEFPASWRDYADNFCNVHLPEGSEDYTFVDGVDLIISLVRSSSQPVTILITGAQTDVALALRKDPGIAENIDRIVIMGGAFDVNGNLNGQSDTPGNSVAEWNIFVDALAAKEVFNSGIPLSVISLDGSDNFLITQNDVARLQNSNDPVNKLIFELWTNSSALWGGDFKIWDIVAVVALTNPELITWENDYLDVITEPGDTHGQTIALEENPYPSGYSSSTDFQGVKSQVFEILLDEKE